MTHSTMAVALIATLMGLGGSAARHSGVAPCPTSVKSLSRGSSQRDAASPQGSIWQASGKAGDVVTVSAADKAAERSLRLTILMQEAPDDGSGKASCTTLGTVGPGTYDLKANGVYYFKVAAAKEEPIEYSINLGP